MQYYEEEFEFEQTGGGKWIRVIGIVLYMIIIIAFAWQTLELVGWLFPSENWFMKAVTVFVCDGCATFYAMAEMFYRFRLRWSKNIIFGMWIVTFIFSTSATVVQMYLSSTNRIPHNIDPGVTMIAYGIIILAFVVNIIAITVVIRMEYNASQPKRLYQDDKEYRRRHLQRVRVVEQPAARALPVQVASREHVVDPYNVSDEVDREKIIREASQKIKRDSQRSSMFDFSLPKVEEKKGEAAPPDTQVDLMAMSIDDRWQEYSKQTAQTPKKKGKMTRREVIGLEEKEGE